MGIDRDSSTTRGALNERRRIEMAEISDVTDATFESEVLKSATPVLVDFWAEWCGPCKAIAPIIKEIADDNGDKLKVVKINIDESPQTPGTYGIRSIPTILMFKDGQVVSQLSGARPKGDFQELVEGVL
jgi:thioredoxin 1